MAVSNEQFIVWLGAQVHAHGDRVQNVREVGKNALNGFYVGRAARTESAHIGRFGNPFYETQHGRFGAIRKYVQYLQAKPQHERQALLMEVREALDAGKKLVCWCAPLACHAHVLAGWALALRASEDVRPPCLEDGEAQEREAPESLAERELEGPVHGGVGVPNEAPKEPVTALPKGPRFARSGS